VDGDPLSAALVSGPSHGTLQVNANGSFTYTPNANYNGADSFTYKVSDRVADSNVATVALTVKGVNDAPAAGADAYATDEDATLTVAAPGVLGNDADADGDALAAALATAPAHAAAFTLNADGGFAYAPAANYNGTDAFTYTASDGHGGTATGTVTLTVRSVNDAPDAADDTAAVAEDGSVNVGVLGNDTDADGDPLAVASVAQGAHGAVTINPDGTVTYTPAANYNGSDAFTYTASDGHGGSDTAAVAVTVTAVNDVPVAGNDAYAVDEDQALTVAAPGVLANDTDADGDALAVAGFTTPAHGTLSVGADGSFTYTPAANYNGADAFAYTVTDGHGGSATGAVSLTVRPVNDPPAAAADAYAVNEDAALTVPATGVLANDTDADGDALTAVLVGGPAVGALALRPDGSFAYTPAAYYYGADAFTYRPTDGTAAGNTVTVALTVNPVNDAPAFAAGPSQTVAEDSGPRTVTNWATGISPGPANEAGQALTFVVVGNSNPALFSAGPAISATGALTFTPAPDASGTATIQVRLRDDGGTADGGVDQSPVQTFTVTVTPLTQVAAVTVNQGAAQRSMVTRVAVTFDGVVSLDAGAFTLTGTTRTGAAQAVQTITVSTAVVGGRTVATLSFSGRGTDQGSLADGLWTLRVVGSKVHDAGTGQAMAADYTSGLHRLFGDANGDRRVDSVDQAAFNAAYGKLRGQAGYVDYFDFDVNGAIERKDRDQFNSRFGTSL
jgi:VCBS repeat-containing protein